MYGVNKDDGEGQAATAERERIADLASAEADSYARLGLFSVEQQNAAVTVLRAFAVKLRAEREP